LGASFIGQCALEKRRILISDIPHDVVPIGSVLLKAQPRSLVVYPVVFEDQVKAVLMLGSIKEFAPAHLAFLEQLTASIGIVLNSIEATMQTEALLNNRSS
jgi:GAF domain-containing protein